MFKKVAKKLAVASLLLTLIVVPGASLASATPPTIHPDGAPSGCTVGDFCSYNQTNGGDLCAQMYTDGNLPIDCADQNNSVYNFTSYSTYMYYDANETGAYYILGSDDYLLSMNAVDFNHCPGGGTRCAGYGQSTQYNVESISFN